MNSFAIRILLNGLKYNIYYTYLAISGGPGRRGRAVVRCSDRRRPQAKEEEDLTVYMRIIIHYNIIIYSRIRSTKDEIFRETLTSLRRIQQR